MTVRIPIPGEGVDVTATCGTCEQPVSRTGGSVSWRCDTAECPTRLIPMFEDARFVDDGGTVWILTDDGEWIDVAEDFPA